MARADRLRTDVVANVRRVREIIGQAADRSGRDPASIRLVAAAKSFAAAEVVQAIDGGIRDVGENYVQEGIAKREAIAPGSPVAWHLIGTLQRNKARAAVRAFDWIHSVDRVALAGVLDDAAAALGKRMDCLVEVNLGAEGSKGGVAASALPGFLEALAEFPSIFVHGLMVIPPLAERPEEGRRYFARLREIAFSLSGLRLPNVELKELSMGMSADFGIAIEEGATMVRVGRAIFGPREARG